LSKRSVEIRKEIAVLDIGTTKICCAIGKKDSKGYNINAIDNNRCIKIYGVGYQSAIGIKRNSITNLDDLETSIMGTIATAEKDAQKSIKSVLVALPPWVVSSNRIQNSINLGQLPVDDIHITSLQNINVVNYIDSLKELIHIFPISYAIDEATGIQKPIGMIGSKLSADIHVITASGAIIKNIKNCLNRNNIGVEGFVSSSYASGLSVLLEEEIMSGVTLIDFGGATTSVSFFHNGTMLQTSSIPIGSQNITNDISIILRTTTAHAERLKILYGVTGVSIGSDDEQCLVPRIDEYGEERIQNISRNMLDSIICARLEEIIELVQNKIRKNRDYQATSQRIVMTGGGSRISGLNEFIKARRYFETSSTRLGKPICTSGSHDFVQSPSFSTCSGTILYYLQLSSSNQINQLAGFKRSLGQKLITWFRRGV
jgi:cell division protein FtsA